MRYQKLTMERFDELVRDWDETLEDVTTNLEKTAYQATTREIATEQSTVFGLHQLKGKLTDRGWFTLCQRLGAPARWLESDNCPIDLNQYVIDRLKVMQDKDSLLRFRNGDTCRAILSDRYMTYNHLDLWLTVKKSIETTKLSQLKPMIWKPTIDDWMQAWILFDGVVADPDDEIQSYDGGGAGGLKPAIHIRNAEDGTGRVGVKSGLYRSYCDNGVIFGFRNKSEMTAIHLGNNQHLVSARISVAVGEAVRMAGAGIEKYLESTHEYIREGIDDVVEDWSKRYKISTELTEQWKGFLGRSRTWADVVMATSDFGGTLKDANVQTQFEELSGELLYAPHGRYVERI